MSVVGGMLQEIFFYVGCAIYKNISCNTNVMGKLQQNVSDSENVECLLWCVVRDM